ncbi:PAS domain S-box-containing protein/diguanylate cyclase (GGDEF) domain-containing protein [Massilia yuzhufengensis]|uniref:PAS domain S-box-containing protein/diguanylate cyclase (GGDEF) domain-containing protein n=2 Tax=Massilia yuzhufengensis TaxID=1164594 RepID=A0A1I1WQ15_9BURK|nr:PAS domain S-box-containing protein/diguanylate cyclase (GGDEF) domain-containing protein [Massilia yuzhufengensis]
MLAQAGTPPRVVRVGIYTNAPKIYFDGQGQANGILVDVLRAIAAAEGWELRFVGCEWARCLAAASAGDIDLLPDVAWSEERSRILDFHQVPALFSWSQIYRRTDVPLNAMTDTTGKRIAVLSGSIQQNFFTEMAKNFGMKPQLVPVASVEDGFDLVERGGADAVVASKYAGTLYAPSRGIVETPIMFQPVRLFYASGKGRNAALLAAIDRRLDAWQRDPDSDYFGILEHWQTRSMLAQVPAYIWWGALLVIAMLAMAVATAAWLRKQVAHKTGALRESEQRLATILDSVDGLIYIKDTSYRYAYANRALEALVEGRIGDIIGKQDTDLFAPPVAAALHRNDVRAIAKRERVVAEETVPDRHGRQMTVLSTKIPLHRDDGSVYGLCGISIDISERRAAEESTRVAASVFRSAEGMFIAGPDRRIQRVNEAFCAMTGHEATDLAGAFVPWFALGSDGADARDIMWDAAENHGKWQGEIWTHRKNGDAYPARLTVTAVRDENASISHFVGTQGDITEQKLAQDEIAKLAYFDSLTGLPNRRLLLERLGHCVSLRERSGQMPALLFFDLDNFKDFNDLHGHQLGDQLLRQVGERIRTCTRAGDTVARLGGDEFVVLLDNVGRTEQEAGAHASAIGWKIIAAVAEPFIIGSTTHRTTCSLGAALQSDSGIDSDEMMKRADMAMYSAKKDGRNTMRFFDPGMASDVSHRLALEEEIRTSLGTSGFSMHYQPQVDVQGRITGAEALLRWNSPKRGAIGPSVFIPIAEASGLIVPLGRWALHTACAQLACWKSQPGLRDLTVSVNVSIRQFRERSFVQDVVDTVSDTGVSPSKLKLELTETVLIDDVDDTIEKMRQLKELGVNFSLDDFGTGYSSLSYLKRLPINQLKIDRSFVRDILTNPNDASIARSIVALSQALGLGIIAEGVETEEQRNFLAEIGCSFYQGYLFGRPMEAASFERSVRAQDD